MNPSLAFLQQQRVQPGIGQTPENLTIHNGVIEYVNMATIDIMTIVGFFPKPELFQAFPCFLLLSNWPGWLHHHPETKVNFHFSDSEKRKRRFQFASTLKFAKLGARLAGSEVAPKVWM